MWRLQELHKPDKWMNAPFGFGDVRWHVNKTEISKAIMEEIGTDDRTIKDNISSLLKMGWLKRHTRHCFEIKDVPE